MILELWCDGDRFHYYNLYEGQIPRVGDTLMCGSLFNVLGVCWDVLGDTVQIECDLEE